MIYIAIGSLIVLTGVVFTLTFTLSTRVYYYANTVKIDPIKAIIPQKTKQKYEKVLEKANARLKMEEIS